MPENVDAAVCELLDVCGEPSRSIVKGVAEGVIGQHLSPLCLSVCEVLLRKLVVDLVSHSLRDDAVEKLHQRRLQGCEAAEESEPGLWWGWWEEGGGEEERALRIGLL